MLFYHFNGASISPYTHFVARPNRSLRFPPVYWLTTPQKFVRDLCVMVRRSDTPSASAMSTACLQLSVMSLPVHSLSESNFCRCSHSKSESWNPFTPIRISVPSRLVHSDPAAMSWRCPCWPTWKLVFSRFRWLMHIRSIRKRVASDCTHAFSPSCSVRHADALEADGQIHDGYYSLLESESTAGVVAEGSLWKKRTKLNVERKDVMSRKHTMNRKQKVRVPQHPWY